MEKQPLKPSKNERIKKNKFALDAFGTDSEGEEHSGSVTGTYNGVPGTFKCQGTACTSTTNVADQIVLAATGGGSWNFKPDSETARVMSGDLAEWGWWISKTGDLVQDVGLYYLPASSGIGVSDFATDHTGTATYTGEALGKYAFTGSSDHGHFKATAKLTADFNTGAALTEVADGIERGLNAGVDLSGEITSFMVNDETTANNWKVVLQEVKSADGSITGGKTLWHIDDTGPNHDTIRGNWAATMYTIGTSLTELPDVVLGGFSAEHNSGKMVGSFGASK